MRPTRCHANFGLVKGVEGVVIFAHGQVFKLEGGSVSIMLLRGFVSFNLKKNRKAFFLMTFLNFICKGNTPASTSITALGVVLTAPKVLLRPIFCTTSNLAS